MMAQARSATRKSALPTSTIVAIGFALLSVVRASSALAQSDEAPRNGEAAHHPNKCVEAYENGQRQRKLGDLTAARRNFLICASRGCPSAMHADCDGWLDEVWTSLPTVVLRAVDPEGNVLADAQVSIDGDASRPLNGLAIPLNPGQHEVEVTHRDQVHRTQIFLAEGEKLTRHDIQVPGPEATARGREPQAAAANPPLSSPTREQDSGIGSSSLSLPVVVGGAAGALGTAGFVYFGLNARSDEDALTSCSPNCSTARVRGVRRQYLLSNVSLGVGIAGLVTLGLGIVLNESEAEPQRAAAEGIEVTSFYLDRGLVPTWRGTF